MWDYTQNSHEGAHFSVIKGVSEYLRRKMNNIIVSRGYPKVSKMESGCSPSALFYMMEHSPTEAITTVGRGLSAPF